MDGLIEGRIVHYVLYEGEHRAAVVSKVKDKGLGIVELNVFWTQSDVEDNKSLTEMNTEWIQFSETPKPYTWHWVEKA